MRTPLSNLGKKSFPEVDTNTTYARFENREHFIPPEMSHPLVLTSFFLPSMIRVVVYFYHYHLGQVYSNSLLAGNYRADRLRRRVMPHYSYLGGDIIHIGSGVNPAQLYSTLREANRIWSIRGRDLTSILEPYAKIVTTGRCRGTEEELHQR